MSVICRREKNPIDLYFDSKAKPLDKLMVESQNRLLPLLILNNEIWGMHISAVDSGQKTYQMRMTCICTRVNRMQSPHPISRPLPIASVTTEKKILSTGKNKKIQVYKPLTDTERNCFPFCFVYLSKKDDKNKSERLTTHNLFTDFAYRVIFIRMLNA